MNDDQHLDLLTKVYERQGETIAKLDSINAELADHRSRIRRLERFVTKVTAYVTLVTGGIAAAWHYFTGRNA